MRSPRMRCSRLPRSPRILRRFEYTASWASMSSFHLRRPRSGSEMYDLKPPVSISSKVASLWYPLSATTSAGASGSTPSGTRSITASKLRLRLGQRLRNRRRVAFVRSLNRDCNQGARIQVDRMLGLVGQMRATVLHLRDLRVGIGRARPVLVRGLVATTAIQPRQRGPRRSPDPGLLRQPRQEFVVLLSRVAPHDATHGGIRLQRGRVDAYRLALQQMLPGENCLHPREDLAVRLHVDQPARARDRRVVRRRLAQAKSEKAPNRQRIRGTPGDPPFRVQSLEVPEQQEPEVTSGRQARSAHAICVKLLTQPLGEPVEATRFQQYVQSPVERVSRALRQIAGDDPQRVLPLLVLSHGHAPNVHSLGSTSGPLARTFTTGC